jgi:uncharacterized surface protein with fasciclin (FAS1) repeats
MNSKNILKTLAMLFSMSAIVMITSCGEDEPDPEPEPEPTENILQILSANAEYSDLVEFYTANAAVLPALDGTTEYTLFAPSNTAFDILRETLDTEDLTTVAPEIIAGVLAFHLVPGTTLEADFGSALTTYQGEQITWNTDNTIIEGGSNTAVNVLNADQKATNGVVHEVDRILIPPTVFQAIGLNLGTLAQPVLLGASFSDLRQILAVADSDVPAGQMSITQMLQDQSGTGYTVFFPANEVLDGIVASSDQIPSKEALIAMVTTAQGDFTAAQVARGFLLNHIYTTDNASDALTVSGLLADVDPTTGVGATLTMASGKQLTILAAPAGDSTPTGCTNGGDSCIFLVGDLADQSTYVPIFLTDQFDYLETGSAVNGALHISAIVL